MNQFRGAMKRIGRAALPVAIMLVTSAHAVVSPGVSRPGAYERYVLRVPNESDNPTVRIEMTFPAEVRVISFVEVPGWTLKAVMDSTGRAVSATWTGTLAPERFVELPFMAVNPKTGARIAWPVIQTYANGDRAEWTGPRDSEHPASITELGEPRDSLGSLASLSNILAVLATMVALAALLLSLRGGGRRDAI
ncbi:MAG TPA: YcnI family protein [Gemmatimonadaceae bacterium]|nr:YcnI family protein [Gemmatimonadaceae bacterium]